MENWLPRGVIYAALMVVLRLVQGGLINTWQRYAGLISMSLMAVFVAAAFAWGVLDGLADARANPDPDRRRDLPMRWLIAGLIAGLASGAVTWLISLVYGGLYASTLLNELTAFAAFTTLLLFVPAVAGAATGRWWIDRQYAKQPARHHGLAAEEQTDVFAAVGAGSARAESESGAATEAITEATPTQPQPTQPQPTQPNPAADDATQANPTEPIPGDTGTPERD